MDAIIAMFLTLLAGMKDMSTTNLLLTVVAATVIYLFRSKIPFISSLGGKLKGAYQYVLEFLKNKM